MSAAPGSALWFLSQPARPPSPPALDPHPLGTRPLAPPSLITGSCVETWHALLQYRDAAAPPSSADLAASALAAAPPQPRRKKRSGRPRTRKANGSSSQAAGMPLAPSWVARGGEGKGSVGERIEGEGRDGQGDGGPSGGVAGGIRGAYGGSGGAGPADALLPAASSAGTHAPAASASALSLSPSSHSISSARATPATLSPGTNYAGGGSKKMTFNPIAPYILKRGHLNDPNGRADLGSSSSSLRSSTSFHVKQDAAPPPAAIRSAANRSPPSPPRARPARPPSIPRSTSTTPELQPQLSQGQAAPSSSAASSSTGDEILVLTRFSSMPDRYRVGYGTLTREQCELNVVADAERCVQDGRRAASRAWQLDGDEVFLPFLAFGTATKAPSYWRRQGPDTVPEAMSGPAFLAKLPTAELVVVIGHDAVTTSFKGLLEEFAEVLPEDAQIVVTQTANRGEPLCMTAAELVEGLHEMMPHDGDDDEEPLREDADAIVDDVWTWLEGMSAGAEYRERLSAAVKSRGEERWRRGRVAQGSAARRPPVTDREPETWGNYVRCGRENCAFVGMPRNVRTHRKSGRLSVCFGRCPGGCRFTTNMTIAQKRAHIEKRHSELHLCPLATCLQTFTRPTNMRDHAALHDDGRSFPSGLARGNAWLTEERAMTRPILAETADSPWPDLSG